MILQINNLGLNLIKVFESFAPKVYICPAGVETIGYGETNRKIIAEFRNKEMTEEYASNLLLRSLIPRQIFVSQKVKVQLTSNQYSALVSLCYNIGRANFGSSTLLRLLNLKQYEQIPAQFKRWVFGGGIKLNGLVRRRDAEIELWNLN